MQVGEPWEAGAKVVYRQYATLYFVFVVDGCESELGILDLIHAFVQTLDSCFADVCERDFIFNMDKVRTRQSVTLVRL